MSKYREDLVVPAFRIMEAIAANDWLADPQRVRVDFTPIFGYEVLEIALAFRIRVPFLNVRLERRKGKRRNRITISACYLCLRWVNLNEDSPLWYLTEKPLEVRKGKGVFYDENEKQWKLLTYQVVEDMNHTRRMFIHIFANYQRELSRNEAIQREIEQRVASSTIFGPALSPVAREEMARLQSWLGRRWQDMGLIKGKLGGRSDLVHYYATRVQWILRGIARTLVADADNLNRGGTFSRATFKTHLEQERAKLDRMVSRNIRSLRRQAQHRIDKAIDALEKDRVAAGLFLLAAEGKLQLAIEAMERWAESIPSEEVADAARYRGVPTLQG